VLDFSLFEFYFCFTVVLFMLLDVLEPLVGPDHFSPEASLGGGDGDDFDFYSKDGAGNDDWKGEDGEDEDHFFLQGWVNLSSRQRVYWVLVRMGGIGIGVGSGYAFSVFYGSVRAAVTHHFSGLF
jgi:hypothetical protein